MKTKCIAVFIVLLMGTFLMVSSAGAYSVTLDGVNNAGWYTESLESSYLKVLTGDGSLLSYDGTTRPWDSFDEMVSSLNGTSYTLSSGGNVFGTTTTDPIYKTLSLSAGNYKISMAAGSDIYNLTGYSADNYNPSGTDLWNAYVQIWGYGIEGFAFGSGEAASADVSAMLASLTSISLFLAQDTTLYFYINDSNSLDNTGSVTLDITAVPEPGTLLLLGAGMLSMAAAGQAFRKNRKS